jgi:hypothetical protein
LQYFVVPARDTLFDSPGIREFERLGRAMEQAKLKVSIGASFALSEAEGAAGKSSALGELSCRTTEKYHTRERSRNLRSV